MRTIHSMNEYVLIDVPWMLLYIPRTYRNRLEGSLALFHGTDQMRIPTIFQETLSKLSCR